MAELLDGREERLEVEDDGAAEGEPAQRLPVDAEVDAAEGQVGDLVGAEVLVRVTGGHEEGFVDFETPGAALDGAVGGEVGEVSGLGLVKGSGLWGGWTWGAVRTGPLRIPSWLCSRGLGRGSP